jgi:hypothetical protein
VRLRWFNNKVAVLGCGPAGLFAVHALLRRGYDVTVYSKPRQSEMFGAQYLHAPIPQLTPSNEKPLRVHYKLEGDVAGYREKVYGNIPVKVSPEALTMEHDAWDIRKAYDRAWYRYGGLVNETIITPEWMRSGELDRFGAVVSSVPLPILCEAKDIHEFHAARIWAMGDAPERGQFAPFRPEPGTVICDGTKDRGWYRASNLYDHATVEWPYAKKPPLPGIAEVVKPIYSTCDCYTRMPWTFLKVGRYGVWSKSVLTHHAYTTASAL